MWMLLLDELASSILPLPSWLITSSWKSMSASCQCYGWSSPCLPSSLMGILRLYSWNFILLFTWLLQYCGDIFRLCLFFLLIETHCCWFLYQFESLVSPSICIPSHAWWTVATSSGWSSHACSWITMPGLPVVAIALGGFAYCNQPWWTPCHHLDRLLTNCMPLHLLTQLLGSVAISCFWHYGQAWFDFMFLTLWSGLIHFPYSGQSWDHT
jgi:hypothetical protein